MIKSDLKWSLGLVVALSIAIAILGCQDPGKGEFFYGTFGLEKKLIVATGGTLTASPFQLIQYSLTGEFEKVLYDSTVENRPMRGVAIIDPFSMLISTDTVDGILKYDVFDGISQFVGSGNLSGNIYNVRRKRSTGEIFVIESTAIESFDSAGNRIGNPRITNTAIGSCLLNGAVRGMDFNSAGYMIVGSQGNDDILMYDVSEPANTLCVAANQTMGNLDPISVLAHSNGTIYVATTNGTDSVLQFAGNLSGTGTAIWTGIATSQPSALVELPDGTILLAVDLTNNIIRMDTEGNILNEPFILDGFTTFVHDMAITEVP